MSAICTFLLLEEGMDQSMKKAQWTGPYKWIFNKLYSSFT